MTRPARTVDRGRPFRFAWFLMALVVSWTVSVTIARAELDRPRTQDGTISRLVTLLLNQQHLSGHALDDEISQRTYETFLKSLDPMKYYFNQSDMDEFELMRDKLDDQLGNGDISFAYKVFNRFLLRIDERLDVIDELLQTEHDFTIEEVMVKDRDMLTHASNAAEVRERWRKRIKFDLLVQKVDDKREGEEAIEKLRKRYHSFAKRMKQTDADELLERYLTAMTTGYDPHTTYMSPSTLENFEIQMRLELDGIGAALQSVDGTTSITKIIPGGAADKEGSLKTRDEIIGVGQGDEGEIVDTRDMKLSQVVQLIRGKRGTVVRLKVIPFGKSESTIYKITRARIELKDSEARGQIIEEGTKPNGAAYKVGVIDLPSFYMDMAAARANKPDYKSTTRDVKKILAGFRANGVDAVVLDLRINGGGSLTESINLTGLFIDQGPVVQVKNPKGNVQHYDDLQRGADWEGPLVVLTSKFSASASEIFAGAIQDYGRGIIVGDHTTHGKGTVQSLLDLKRQLFAQLDIPNLGALKVTIQKFYRPSGESTQRRGVLADIELPALTTHLDVGEADLDHALKFDTVPKATYQPVGQVNESVLKWLRLRSTQRVAKSEEFQKVLDDIARYKEQRDRKVVSLNEATFVAQRAKLDLNKDDPKDDDPPKDEVVKRDFYFNEALAITIDYVGEFAKLTNGRR